ncbi:MAG: M28 family peptidase, partial [Planctomycetota bacterium]
MGRVPGSAGMERSKDYVQTHFELYGLQPAFPDEYGNQFASFRDPFELGGTWIVDAEGLSADGRRGDVTLVADEDFVLTGLGGAGELTEQAVFVGFGIDEGPDGFSSFRGDADLEGKIAVLFRYEPMDEEGNSLWNDGEAGWSDAAQFVNKLGAIQERGAAGAIIVNPPGVDVQINRFRSGGGGVEFPVMMATPEAAEKLINTGREQRTIGALLRHANDGREMIELGTRVTMIADAGREEVIAENVGGLIPGVGDLADEYIVIGAHLDHLGMGYFGSRSGPGELHPGADDNASGSAGLILIADKLTRAFAERPDEPRRSILIVAFSGEESGLNGSFHYVRDPIVPAEDHVLMVNWDMIGRIENERVLVAGGYTGEGLEDFIQPFMDASGLECVVPETMSGASDHTPFYRAGVPVLFSIIADFHEDYHTPADVVWKINRVGAVKTVEMYSNIVQAAAVRPDRFDYVEPQQTQAQRPVRGIRVRIGIQPDYNADASGITLAGVSTGGPAEEAGLREGDVIVRWDGQKITDLQSWMQL